MEVGHISTQMGIPMLENGTWIKKKGLDEWSTMKWGRHMKGDGQMI